MSQFLDEKGELCFAFDNGKYVSVVKTKNGKPASKDIKLKKKSSIFGAVTCDKNGNFYVVSEGQIPVPTHLKKQFISQNTISPVSCFNP